MHRGGWTLLDIVGDPHYTVLAVPISRSIFLSSTYTQMHGYNMNVWTAGRSYDVVMYHLAVAPWWRRISYITKWDEKVKAKCDCIFGFMTLSTTMKRQRTN